MIFGNRSINKNLFLFNGQFEYIWKENKNSEFLLISYHNSFFAFFGNQIACNISCTKNIGIKNIIPIIMHNISSIIEWFLIGWVKKLEMSYKL